LPELVGKRFGNLIVESGEVLRVNGHPHITMRCLGCGAVGPRAWSTVKREIAGCRKCGNPRRAPKWLWSRCANAQQRCTNPKDARYADYGGRGIRFLFETPLAMATWVIENLGLNRDLQIDRIDNNGHYAPGNLRLSTPSMNMSHTRRRPLNAEMHRFKTAYPEIRYADGTLRHLIARGLSDEEIVERFHTPSFKPKGVYGTCSTPDPDIASLSKGSSSRTA
jgi:hypothetical protein